MIITAKMVNTMMSIKLSVLLSSSSSSFPFNIEIGCWLVPTLTAKQYTYTHNVALCNNYIHGN